MSLLLFYISSAVVGVTAAMGLWLHSGVWIVVALIEFYKGMKIKKDKK